MDPNILIGSGSTTPILIRRSVDSPSTTSDKSTVHNVVLPWSQHRSASHDTGKTSNSTQKEISRQDPSFEMRSLATVDELDNEIETPREETWSADSADAKPSSCDLVRTFGPIFTTIFFMSFVSGLIVPLLALILEREGESALFNGVSTMAVYVAFLVASPFIAPLNTWLGPKKTVCFSLGTASALTICFPIFHDPYAWIGLRLVFGVCLSAVYVTTEVWLNKVLTEQNRGIGFAGYGFSFTSGLAVGPLAFGMLDIAEFAPFLMCAILLALAVCITLVFSDDANLTPESTADKPHAFRRSWGIITLAPFCLATAFLFGVMDGVLNGDLPIWGTRVNLSAGQISACLTSFMIGTIIAQIPLGLISDRWGRRETLLASTIVGAASFSAIPFFTSIFPMLIVLFVLMGGSLGPTYSLGLALLGDTIKADEITLANVIFMMSYGAGSLFGPFVVSLLITVIGPSAFIWANLVLLALYFTFGILDTYTVRTALRNNCCC